MERTISARFYVSEVTRHAYNPGHATVKLQAAGRGEQNKAWNKATPSGTIELQVNNPDAAESFASWIGKDVALEFSLVDDTTRTSVHGD